MAYDEALAGRLRDLLPKATEKRMFGGVAFLERGNMLVGVHKDALLARVGPDAAASVLKEPGVGPFVMGGKPASGGWVLVDQEAVPEDDDLAAWIERCRRFTKTLPAK
jgi:TfoX/Sxy family transcriptional regulator of competence genes